MVIAGGLELINVDASVVNPLEPVLCIVIDGLFGERFSLGVFANILRIVITLLSRIWILGTRSIPREQVAKVMLTDLLPDLRVAMQSMTPA